VVVKFLTAVAVAYGALAALVFAFQPRMVFQPDFQGRALDVTPESIGLDYHDVSIATGDGETLHGWWVPRADARGTILFSHGNAGNISHRLDSLRLLHQLRLNVLMYDYRGYGQSTGKPAEAGLYRDIDAAWRWLIDERRQAPERIVLFGLLSRIRFDARAEVSGISEPLLIIHSRDDEIVPYDHARKLQAAAGGSVELLTISGGHNTGFVDSQASYTEGLDAFLDRCLDGRRNTADE